jgi:hypothetical protein
MVVVVVEVVVLIRDVSQNRPVKIEAHVQTSSTPFNMTQTPPFWQTLNPAGHNATACVVIAKGIVVVVIIGATVVVEDINDVSQSLPKLIINS